ncbi:unnamed protein product [Linum tenue]|uniref:Uncharacterized protein n=1 Tax=Linum tenue TaxID=586396 RepID=A0AAV0H9I5_9ROSI|nr:unnamed protein product [Linum tenue]
MSGMVILARLSSIYSVCSESAGVAGKAFLLLLPSSSSRSSDELELQCMGCPSSLPTLYWLPLSIPSERSSSSSTSLSSLHMLINIKSIAFVSLRFLDSHTRQLSIGYISVFSLIFMFASPVFIIVPNGIGTILGVVQLALYYHYSSKCDESSRESLLVYA